MDDRQLAALVQEARRRLGARKGANRIYRIPPLQAALPVAPLAGSTSNPISIRFRRPGIVLAIYGQVASGLDADAATTEMRLQVAGTRDLITDGDSGQFAPFLALFGKTQNWFPLELAAKQGTDWTFTYKNTSTLVTTLPSLILSVLEVAEQA
jgi:hypothetical protein